MSTPISKAAKGTTIVSAKRRTDWVIEIRGTSEPLSLAIAITKLRCPGAEAKSAERASNPKYRASIQRQTAMMPQITRVIKTKASGQRTMALTASWLKPAPTAIPKTTKQASRSRGSTAVRTPASPRPLTAITGPSSI